MQNIKLYSNLHYSTSSHTIIDSTIEIISNILKMLRPGGIGWTFLVVPDLRPVEWDWARHQHILGVYYSMQDSVAMKRNS